MNTQTQQENARVGMSGTQDVSRPVVGQIMMVRGQVCTITEIRPFGTVDVVTKHGQSFRVSGLSFI